jgi:hypothetical protein
MTTQTRLIALAFGLITMVAGACSCDPTSSNGDDTGADGGSETGSDGGTMGDGGTTEPLPGYSGAAAELDLVFRRGGTLPNVTANRIVGDGDYLWAYGSGGDIGIVKLLDVSDPLAPVELGFTEATPLPESPGSDFFLEMSAQYPLVFIQTDAFFEGFDFTDPASPTKIADWEAGDVAHLHRTGNRLYAWGQGNEQDVLVFDVTDPASPLFLGKSQGINQWADRFVGEGNTFFGVDYGSLTLYDATDPNAFVELGTYSPGGRIEDIKISGNLVFLATRGMGLRIVDVTDPANPVEVGAFMAGLPMLDADRVAVDGDRAFLSVDSTLHALDVTDPGLVVELGTYAHNRSTNTLLALGNLAVVLDGWGPSVVDFTDPLLPVEHVQGAFNAVDVTSGIIEGDRLYARDREILHVFDLSTPTAPALLGNVELPLYFGTPAAMGDHLLVPRGLVGLSFWNLTDVSSPQTVGGHDLPVQSAQMVFEGSTAWTGYFRDPGFASGGVAGLDLSNANAPALLSHLPINGVHSMSAMSGSRIALTRHDTENSEGFLSVYDVSDSAAPSLLGEMAIDDSHIGMSLDSHGDLVYAAASYDFFTFDFSDPALPTRSESYNSSLEGDQILVDAEDLLVLNGNSSSSSVALYDLNALDTRLSESLAIFEQNAVGMARRAPLTFVATSDRVLHWQEMRHSESLSLRAELEATASPLFDAQDGILAMRFSTQVQLFDFSQGGAFSPLGTYDLSSGVYGITLSPGRLHLATGLGIEVLDIADPLNPALMGTVTDEAILNRGYAANGQAVVTYGGAQGSPSSVVDLRDASNPVITELNHPAANAVLTPEHAYLGTEGIAVYDISDPAAPTELGVILDVDPQGFPLYVRALAQDSGRLYALDGRNRLQVFEEADLPGALPIFRGSFDLAALGPLYVAAMDVRDGFVYLYAPQGEAVLSGATAERSALVVLDARVPENIRATAVLSHAGFASYATPGFGLSDEEMVFGSGSKLALSARPSLPLRLSQIGGNALIDSALAFEASFDSLYQDEREHEVRCRVSGGTCTVTNVDQDTNTATLEWGLPEGGGDFEMAVMAGNYDGAKLGYAQVRLP